MLVGGEDPDRHVGLHGNPRGDGLFELFLNASRSSGMAEAGWRGRGTWIDQPIVSSASQPLCGASVFRPSSPAIQAAALPLARPHAAIGRRIGQAFAPPLQKLRHEHARAASVPSPQVAQCLRAARVVARHEPSRSTQRSPKAVVADTSAIS